MNNPKKCHSEAQHQHALFYWAATKQKEIPALKWLYAIPNGAVMGKSEGYRMKQQGLKNGVADTHLPVSRHGYHSLYIEMKSETGKQSPAQEEFEKFVLAEGHAYRLCRTWESARDVILDYLK